MVPAGPITQETIDKLASIMEEGDTIIDGGNSRFTDSLKRAEALAEKKIDFVDAGKSGGVWGLSEGYCLMVGGDQENGRAFSNRYSQPLRRRMALPAWAGRAPATRQDGA